MATIERAHAEQRFLLRGVSWRTYESLLADFADRSAPKLTYDRGDLEMMSPLDKHEDCRHVMRRMVETWADEWNLPIRGKGARTLKRQELERGLEADEAYYIVNEPLVRGKREIDLSVDPPPDLAIEIDITTSWLDKQDIYAKLRVPEVWLFDGESLRMLLLNSDGMYGPVDDSLNLPGFPAADVPRWFARYYEVDETTWAREFRNWIRGIQGQPPQE